MSELGSKELKRYLNRLNVNQIIPPILAMDYGTKRIGLAITDKKGIVAQPLTTIDVSKGFKKTLYPKLERIIEENQVETLILGLPQAFEDGHLQNINHILEFQDAIEKVTKKKVYLYDETFSTSNSYSILRSQGQKRKKTKKKVDKIAAACFLQELIDFKNKNNE